MKERCDGMVVSKEKPSVTVHAQNAQMNGSDCGLWTLCAVYTRAIRRPPEKSKPHLIFEDMFLKTPLDALHFR